MAEFVELSYDGCAINHVHNDNVELKVRFWNDHMEWHEYSNIYLNKQDLLNMLKLLEEKECE